MATFNRLTARQVDSLKPGNHSDGRNLYLRVSEAGGRSWVFRYSVAGRVKELGLGATHARGLAAARELASAMRAAIANGGDPAVVLKPKLDPMAMTFKQHAETYISAKAGVFRNGKHHAQWTSTLTQYAYPKIGAKRCSEVTYADILAITSQASLKGKAETLSRLKQRILTILDEAAKQEGQPSRYNPAQSLKLPKRPRTQHFAAAPWQDVPRIVAELAAKGTSTANCLLWQILTASRPAEARGALWNELAGDMWALPAARMKMALPHRIPLSAPALELLKVQLGRKAGRKGFVFPSKVTTGQISDVAVSKVLATVADGVTCHGFRSSFRQWGADNGHSREALELALAHSNPNKSEAAYQRSDMYEARRGIMQLWAAHCFTWNI